MNKVKKLSRQLIFFFIASGIAVLADLAIYTLLVNLKIYPGFSNIFSSTVAVTITYLLVTNKAFAATTSWRTYLLFIAWYAISISGFSLIIQYLHSSLGFAELPAKIITLPFSFSVNFTFSKFLFSRKRFISSKK